MTDTQNQRILPAYRHAYLLGSLLLFFFVRPFLGDRLGVWLVDGLLLVTLVASAYAVKAQRWTLALLWCLCVACATLRLVLGLTQDNLTVAYSFLGCYSLFCIIVVACLVRLLLRARQAINADTLCAALSGYLLLGLLWTYAFAVLELAAPGSFSFGVEDLDVSAKFERLAGFSLTTLTTLGYGNVAPTNPRSDALATLEAIIGQGYLAIVIARLVALQLMQSSQPRRDSCD